MNAENTRYGYKNAEGHRLHVSTVGADLDHVELAIAGVGDLGWRSLNIPAAEVPGIALALLKAGGFTSNARTEPSNWQESVEVATGYLDDALFLAQERAQERAEKLNRRRNDLAMEVAKKSEWSRPDTARFADLQTDAQAAIDMIISLQDEAKK